MKTIKHRISLAILLASGAAFAANAGAASTNLGVSATVSASCSISTTSALEFGAYDPAVANASTDKDGTGVISVTCTSGAPVSITLGEGGNADTGSTAAAPLRRMVDAEGTHHLSYSLYSDSGRSVVWGDDAAVDVETIGTGGAEALTVYGRIPGGQNVPSGVYNDIVVATVTF